MVAALLKTLHSGIQDLRLLPPKGQPKSDFFKKVFMKTGRFTTQWARIEFDQVPDFGKTVYLTLPRQGHLISRMYLVANFPDIVAPQLEARAAAAKLNNVFVGPTFGWTNSLGHALLTELELTIGGTPIERLDFRLLEVLDEFRTPLEKVSVVNRLIQRYDTGYTPYTIGWDPSTPTSRLGSRPARVAVPLPFWFSSGDSGAALPIDALSIDKVQLKVKFASVGSLYTTDIGGDNPCHTNFLGATFTQKAPSTECTNTNPEIIISGVAMPSTATLGETYLMVEYVYLDKPEANRFRLADITVPIPQHYAMEPFKTLGQPEAIIPLQIPNPTRDIFFFAQRIEATNYNAPFLATRDLSGADAPVAPWWPNAVGLNPTDWQGEMLPGYALRDSEPIQSMSLMYEGRLVRYGTDSPVLFRTIMPSMTQRKSPWINKYYYNMSFGVLNGTLPDTLPSGEANLDKIRRINLQLRFNPLRGSVSLLTIPSYTVYIWAETYNILKIYGGRGTLMFSY